MVNHEPENGNGRLRIGWQWAAALCLSLAINVVVVAYLFGRLEQRVETLEVQRREERVDRTEADRQMGERIKALEDKYEAFVNRFHTP